MFIPFEKLFQSFCPWINMFFFQCGLFGRDSKAQTSLANAGNRLRGTFGKLNSWYLKVAPNRRHKAEDIKCMLKLAAACSYVKLKGSQCLPAQESSLIMSICKNCGFKQKKVEQDLSYKLLPTQHGVHASSSAQGPSSVVFRDDCMWE